VVFNHPNHLGNMLAFGVAFCFASLSSHTKLYIRLILWILLAALVHALLMTFSRGAWLACSVGLFVSLIYLYKLITVRRLALSLLLLAISLFGSMAIDSHIRNISSRVVTSSPSSDASIGHRLAVWRTAVDMIYDHWLIGVGIGRFGEVLDSYKTGTIKAESYSSALNNYVTLAAEAGMPVLTAYILMLVCASVLASRSLAKTDNRTEFQVGMLCGVYTMLVFGATTYTFTSVYAAVLTGSILGYSASPVYHKKSVSAILDH
jgi:O-antigen ligase